DRPRALPLVHRDDVTDRRARRLQRGHRVAVELLVQLGRRLSTGMVCVRLDLAFELEGRFGDFAPFRLQLADLVVTRGAGVGARGTRALPNVDQIGPVPLRGEAVLGAEPQWT